MSGPRGKEGVFMSGPRGEGSGRSTISTTQKITPSPLVLPLRATPGPNGEGLIF